MSGVMADRLVAALCATIFAFSLVVGYVWGRVNGGRALDRAWRDGYEDGCDDEDRSFYDDDPPDPPDEGGERLYQEGETVILPLRESPYGGRLTPAQRRRDKHKQRGQYAPGGMTDDVGGAMPELPRRIFHPDPRQQRGDGARELREPAVQHLHRQDGPGADPAYAGGGAPLAAPVPYPALAPEVLDHQNVPRPGRESAESPDPGPGDTPPEIGWVERQLYVGAIEISRIVAAEARAMEAFHADALAWDRFMGVWAEDARAGLEPSWVKFGKLVTA